MRMVGIRGATTVADDDATQIEAATSELLEELLSANALEPDDLVSIVFTATPDLHSAYPATAARAARGLGLEQVALLGAQEIHVDGGMPRVIRVLIHAYSDIPARHVFLGEAQALRPDLSQGPS